MDTLENLDTVNIHFEYDICRYFDFKSVFAWISNIVQENEVSSYLHSDKERKGLENIWHNLRGVINTVFTWNYLVYKDPIDQYIYICENWEKIYDEIFKNVKTENCIEKATKTLITVNSISRLKIKIKASLKLLSQRLLDIGLKHQFKRIGGVSVTQFLDNFLEWEKGFWDWKSGLDHVKLKSDETLLDRTQENLHGAFIGTFVDRLVRFKITENFLDSFDVPIRGFERYKKISSESEMSSNILEQVPEVINKFRNKKDFQFNLEDLHDLSKLIPYEIYFRSGVSPEVPNTLNELTIKNIQILVNRTIDFLTSLRGKLFAGEAIAMQTNRISSGDWDYLVGENLIDLKITKRSCSLTKNWLQLLIYYLLGKESGDPKFKKVKNLILFNAHLNDYYLLEIKNIPKNVIDYLWSQIN